MSTKNPLVSIIIVTLNNKTWLEKCINALHNQEYKNIEIIVIDNDFINSSKNFALKKYKKIIYIQNEKNIGYGSAANIGIKHSKGEYILLYNDDAVCSNNFITLLVSEMEHDSSLGACQGVLLSYDKPDTVESIGSYFTITGILWKEAGFHYDSKNIKKQYVFNANLPLIRKKILNKVGLFDEDYFLYFEEADLCWRIWQSGYRISVVPEAKIWHKSGETTKKINHSLVIQSTYQNRINSLIKNLEIFNMLIILPIHLLYIIFSFSAFLLLGKFSIAFSIIRAIFANIIILPFTLRKRFFLQNNRKLSDAEIFKFTMKKMTLNYLLRTSRKYFFEW